jgi:hypothetical protein
MVMARLVVEGEELVVRLTWLERLLTRRREVRVPLTDVQDVTVEADWWRALRGLRRTGRWLPDRFCVGVWRHPRGRDFVAIREHGPVVLVDLRSSAPFARLAVSTADLEDIARAIRRGM